MTTPGNSFVSLASCTLLLACGTAPDDGITNPALLGEQVFAASSNFSSWSVPVSLGPTINTSANETQPALSRNGLTLYFTSTRPEHSGDAVFDNNIWIARRACVGCPWNAPVILGPAINGPGNDAAPNLSRDEHQLFFTTNRAGSQANDIWVSYRQHVHDDFGWQPPVNLGSGINTAGNETGANYFANDDDDGAAQLFFNRQVGPANIPSGDIYVSELSADGTWGPASPVSELNSPAADQRPSSTRNGLQIYFWSGRDAGRGQLGDGYLWQASRRRVEDPWSPPELVPSPISDRSSITPFIHAHGRTETLLFVHNVGTRTQLNLDIVMSTRTRGHGDSDDGDSDDEDSDDEDSNDEDSDDEDSDDEDSDDEDSDD